MPILRLPGVLQRDAFSCGDASIATVLAFHRVVAPSKLATPIDGTDPASIERHLRRIGLHVLSGSLHVDDLEHFCRQFRPPIVLATWPDGGDSHWVVVRGVSRGRVYFHCPIDGAESLRISEWDAIWHGSGKMGERYTRWGVVAWT